MNGTLAAQLDLDINSPRLHYHCTTHGQIADQRGSRLIGDQERKERTNAR